MKVQSMKKGFTLIELLVVITIIGILATGGVSVFTTQLQGARDSTRISDIKLIETGIYQYFNDIWEYPPQSTTFTSSGGIRDYLSKILNDPKAGDPICWDDNNANNTPCGWSYNRSNDGFGLTNSAFKLGIVFEKKANLPKAENDGGTWSSTNPNSEFYFETFAWAGAEFLGVGTGATTVTALANAWVETDMSESDNNVIVY